VAQGRLDQLAADGQVPADVLAFLRARHDHRAGQLPKDPKSSEAIAAAAELRAELIAAEREYIYRLLQQGQITDEARRRIERELDLEEESLAFKRDSVDDPPL
jgi:monovalent cation/hydrogen antiporter